MRSLAELIAENDALVRRAEKRRNDSIRRLKQRIARAIPVGMPSVRRDMFETIDAWCEAERKRGGR